MSNKFISRSAAIAAKEIRQLRRDRLTLSMIFGVPMMQLLLFGYAINLDVRHLSAAVVDQANTQLSRELVQTIRESQVAEIAQELQRPEQLEDLLRKGLISIGVFIPRDFERRITQNDRAAAQLLVDASDPVVLNTASHLLDMPLGMRREHEPTSKPLLELRAYYNPERRSAVFIVPGLIGVILTMTMVLFTAVAIVREKERGNLEFLITTPIRKTELMVGKILPYILIGLVQVTLVLLLGRFLFSVPFRGTLFNLYLCALIFIVASLSLGLFISTLAKTQFQAFQLTFFTFLPQILLSGFMFPFEGMPKAAQWFAEILPLTHFVRMSRGVLLRNASFSDVHRDIWPLVLFFMVMLTLSVSRFSKRLD